MLHPQRRILQLALAFCAASLAAAGADPTGPPLTLLVLTKDGDTVTGTVPGRSLTFAAGGSQRSIAFTQLLSVHSASPATAAEAARIAAGLKAVAGSDRPARERAMADLPDIGLPVLSPLLAAYKDVDGREPDPLYHLFERIVPGYADARDRTLDLVRLANGETLRGQAALPELQIAAADGKTVKIAGTNIRRLAVQQKLVERTFELQALRHCTFIEYLDTGVWVTPASTIDSRATGFVRLSFDEDGWATDPDGIETPLPGKRLLNDGFRWGILLGRVGPAGERWAAGKSAQKAGLGQGRLYFVINDNEHWQNNIGSYRVRLRATNACDLGDPR